MTHRAPSERRIDVEGIARVEGEGSLHAVIEDHIVREVSLEIFEPPRYFEALLRGRRQEEAPDITARICGICPIAYQLSASRALEAIASVEAGARIEALRRLLYCGEWIHSHALHIYLLHAPDFLGCADAVELAERAPEIVRRGLRIKRAGNRLMELVGGRAIHPVNLRLGGFYSAPEPAQVAALVEELRAARDDALATVEWAAGLEYPDIHGDYLFVALHDENRYAIESGRVASSAGLDASPEAFEAMCVEEHVRRSTALHARLEGRDPYLTGPLARFALNAKQLSPLAREAARAAALTSPCTNPFRSLLVRSVELVEACDEAVRLASSYEPPDPAAVAVPRVAGVGVGATEAPRGILVHRYTTDADGVILDARIVPPTAQNQLSIEADLRAVLEEGLDLDDDALGARCERAVRNHDPCISCAAHFLDLSVLRR